MNHSRLLRLALFFLWPLLLVVADLVVRTRIILAFSVVEWTYYIASMVLMFGAYCGLVWLLSRLRRQSRRWAYVGMLVVVAFICLAVVSFGYGAFLANGDLPDLFLLSYIRCEPENALILFKDSLKLIYAVPLVVGVAGVAFLLDRACRLTAAVPLRGVGPRVIAAGLCYLSMWYCWSGTVARGQCFLPIVRIPAVLAMYGYNEWKGINPQPIKLPPRSPMAIPGKIPPPTVNVLVILNESLRRQSLQLFGNSRETTPFMTRFAAEHAAGFFKFNRAYTNSTTTLLSVPSILTGISPLQPLAYRLKAPLLWQWAKAADMTSFYITSHDLAWCDIGNFLTTPRPDTLWDPRTAGLPHYRDLGCDDHFTVEQAVRHLEEMKNSARPFLGVIHLNTNHYPYNSREEYRHWSGTDSDLYDNTILETDAHTRRIIETLQATGELDHTVVIFCSDHGEAFNEHGYVAHFYSHFAETVSVPMWIYLPPAMRESRDLSAMRINADATVQNLDIMPTILDCIGASSQLTILHQQMLGQSLFQPLPPDRTVWVTNTDEIMPSSIGLSSITGNKHYMIRTSSMPAKENLYDLAVDPLEHDNRWDSLTVSQRDAFRRSFLQFPVAARMMRTAFPNLKPDPELPAH